MNLQPLPRIKDKPELDTTIFAINDRLTKLAMTTVGNGVSLSGALPVVDGQANDLPLGEGTYFEISTPSACLLGGFAGGFHNRQIFVKNVGQVSITIVHQSGTSQAANRFTTRTASDVTLAANDILHLLYSSKVGGWLALTGVL